MVRTGILGGTFDPPHVGHLVVAECARVQFELDEMLFVPSAAPWRKVDPTASAHRLAMTRLAVAENQHVVVDDIELRPGGPTTTYDMLTALAERRPDATLTFVLGADAAGTIDDWYRGTELPNLADFVVAGRNHTAHPDFERVDAPELHVSSSQIRERYAAGKGVRHLVPAAVDDYVLEHGLYGVELSGS